MIKTTHHVETKFYASTKARELCSEGALRLHRSEAYRRMFDYLRDHGVDLHKVIRYEGNAPAFGALTSTFDLRTDAMHVERAVEVVCKDYVIPEHDLGQFFYTR